MDRIYMVIDEDRHDTFTTVCSTLEEANREAENQWGHLTATEKKKRHVYVAFTLPTTDFYEKAELEAYGTEDFDPMACHTTDANDYCFDSEKL